MRPRSLGDVARHMSGELVSGDPTALTNGAAIDTRALRDGELFFALPGSRVHGAKFVPQAWRVGAAAVVVDELAAPELAPLARATGFALIVVPDGQRALARLAEAVRAEERDSLPAIAITGSVGKTTTCGYAATLLSGVGVAHRPPSSFNNQLGVPLTILSAPAKADYLVCEVGTNSAGEVFRLASWVRPKVAIVTAVAPAHLLGFGTLDAIELEKLSILDALEPTGSGWIPADLALRHQSLLRSCRARVKTIGENGDLRVTPVDGANDPDFYQLSYAGATHEFRWHAPFRHSVRNLEAALAAGLGVGVAIEALLERVGMLSNAPLRGDVEQHAGVEFLLDCYNASPASLESAIERLETEPATGRRVCVIGTMEELGTEERTWHQRLGERLASPRVDAVYLLGRGRDWYQSGLRACGREGETLANDSSSAERLASALRPGDRVLFKASRREALETFAQRVAGLLEAPVEHATSRRG
ncbi:MAG: UDP-N-acetylmuramoyl-tripeptide--D-alanyl-D-alanine ligase [Planctomycetota bacterium]